MKQAPARENVRDSILDAADRLMARYGYKKMSMDDLAREVGISKATIYKNFDSKEEVAIWRVDRAIDQLKAKLNQIARDSGNSTERLRRMLIMRVTFRVENVRHYTGSLNEILAAIRPALQKRHEKHFEEEKMIFMDVLEDGLTKRELDFVNSDSTARALIQATNSLLPYSLRPEECADQKTIREQTTVIADLLLNGLKRR